MLNFKNKLDNAGWWNYRFIMKPIYNDNIITSQNISLMEVYYNKDGNIVAWSDLPVSIQIENYKDYTELMRQIGKATKQTILQEVQGPNCNTTLVDSDLYLKDIKNNAY